MRTDYTVKEKEFLAGLARLCADYGVTLSNRQSLVMPVFIGPDIWLDVDGELSDAVNDMRVDIDHERRRPGKALQLKPAELTVTTADIKAE